jgi:general secretion pathway protein G
MRRSLKRCKRIIDGIKTEEGFSLIEIMIVIVIMSILVGLVASSIWKAPDKARVTAAKVKITQLSMPLLEYQQAKGGFPAAEEGLDALVKEGLIKEKDTKDPWGNPFGYRFPGENDPTEFEIWSYGADGKEGGTGVNGDIKSWELEK